ncbi:RNA polymerase factor sigma-54 [Paralimibaculum aggregatum]|uniref:RNA polymerase sigma-54 factor n=1 Tax=Paralimibaculum aggregatum TaxID=3036245 RepID=A0ABQ6LS19_9RHOB|nr:RNA polymerase factor sigma-54 [Limibaculum sp. NKW23]GMG84893.1 RNA polymerase factor sigma-54 [Limibaculum sp. NKW23]
MGAGLRLELRQSQQLVMTPQLQQAIKLLQMSSFELGAFVTEEIERNPLLVAEGPEGGPADAPADPAPETGAPLDGAAEAPADSRVTAEGDHALAEETFDTGSENLFDRDASGGDPAPLPGEGAQRLTRQAAEAEGADGFEARLTRPDTLREHLLAQLGLMRAEAPVLALARLLVEELDEAGYLRTDLAQLAERLGTGPAALEAALALVQRCEPAGVGARDLGECLALQLAERDRLDPAMQRLLGHLDLLARGQVEKLCKLCAVDAEDLADMLADIRRLDPRPGRGFGEAEPETVIPDVFVRPTGWGGWSVELNAEALPRVLIDRRYAAELARGGAQTREFLTACRENANWLVKSLDQRARTILKVAQEIVRHQEGFFEKGPAGLKPLSLKMVADAIKMHESTVSRVTSNKYMATERGIVELKFFFTNAVGGGGEGDAHSAESIRTRLRALVAAETAGTVLSDDRIVEILQGEGIEIARRTVAKYRNAMGIPSSVARRQQLALKGVGQEAGA